MTEEKTASVTGWCNDRKHKACRRPETCPCTCHNEGDPT